MHGAVGSGLPDSLDVVDAPAPVRLTLLGPTGQAKRVAPSRSGRRRASSGVSRQQTVSPPKGSIGSLLSAQVEALVGELSRREQDVRRDEPDGVRKMRVACRRLRSALSTYQPIFSPEQIEPLIGELRWLGGELGTPRDARVLSAHLEAAIRDLPGEDCTGEVMELLASELNTRCRAAHSGLLVALDSGRYAHLLEALDAAVDDPPFATRANRPAGPEAERLVHRTVRRVHKRAMRVEIWPAGAEREHALHDVRNAAKRSRYAAELAAPALGRRFTRLARRMKRLQGVLGEWHEAVAFARLLREVGVVASRIDDGAFTFGVLCGREQARAHHALQRYEPALRDALQRW